MKSYRIFFISHKKEVYALEGSNLFECIMRAGILIKNPCAGQGICGKCKVKVVSGHCPPSSECERFFSRTEIEDGIRLACRVKIYGEMVIEIPPETCFDHELLVLTQEDKPSILDINPFVRKISFSIDPPSLDNQRADFQSLREKLLVKETSIDLLREIPSWLRKNNFCGTALVCRDRLIALEEGIDHRENYAIAIDLGTTSIVASLVDINNGRIIDSKGVLNPQVKFGDDLLSRIQSQRTESGRLNELQQYALNACNELIDELCRKYNIKNTNIYSAAIAGNSVMESFFCGITAEYLGEIPFVPPFKKSLIFRAKDLDIHIHPEACIYVFPLIGGFIGGDIVSGISACRLDEKTKPTLFIDIGTNSEIVISANGLLYAASAAAGPAFEGARIEFGVRAIPGAIEKIVLSAEGVSINTIKNQKPIGICGSAIVDITAELLKWGILDQSGRLNSPDELSVDCPEKLRERIVPSEDGKSWDFIIWEGGDGRKILITQKDLRQIQLATGAIRTATKIILNTAGIVDSDLDVVLIAGGFGSFIRRNNAKRIGLIPDLPDFKIRYVGNTSIEGAREALLSIERIEKAEELSEKTKHIEISLDPEFQTIFTESMFFPDNKTESMFV